MPLAVGATVIGIAAVPITTGAVTLGTVANLSLRTTTALPATATIISRVGATDAKVLSNFSQMVSRGSTFLQQVTALSRATSKVIPGGKVHQLGSFNGNPVFGSQVSGVGIVQRGNSTVIVQKVGDTFKVLGDLFP